MTFKHANLAEKPLFVAGFFGVIQIWAVSSDLYMSTMFQIIKFIQKCQLIQLQN